jgi:DNA polymerase sigma
VSTWTVENIRAHRLAEARNLLVHHFGSDQWLMIGKQADVNLHIIMSKRSDKVTPTPTTKEEQTPDG